MQVAEILSDLTSLRVCDHHDALALVTVNNRICASRLPSELPHSGLTKNEDPQESADDDLRRAKELVELHYEIKARHVDGRVDGELAQAREEVDRPVHQPLHHSKIEAIPTGFRADSSSDVRSSAVRHLDQPRSLGRRDHQSEEFRNPAQSSVIPPVFHAFPRALCKVTNSPSSGLNGQRNLTMATTVDAKLLKQTKFPPEFSRKVDMTKVNIEVMKKWIAGKISEILGNEDDVVIELCFNLLEGSRYPDVKSLQIQLTGFLDKDTAKFCKELWSLCLSAQQNPQGVPKELLEAKKLELIQEKNKSGYESAKWNSCGEESATIAIGEAEGAEAATLIDVGLRRGDTVGSVSESRLLVANSIPTCPRGLVAAVILPDRPVARALDRYPRLDRPLLVGSATQAGTAGAETGPGTEETHTDAAGRRDRRRPRSASSRSSSRSRSRSPLESEEKGAARRRKSSPYSSRADKRESPADFAKARKSHDHRRLSRSRDRDDHRRRRYTRSVSRSRSRSRSRGRTRSVSSSSGRGDSRSRSRSHSRGPRDRKRRRSLQRYAPAARRRRNTSSVSVRSDKRQRMTDQEEPSARGSTSPPPPEKPSSADQKPKDTEENRTTTSHTRISGTELREKLLREKLVAMRRTTSNNQPGR
ncbi:hypothetical protein P170DRAFT_423505 [Aspergillus steynii IBT 23096]|uniref:PWI domain-containing protein n=1 Tax=Aspergillus steynii IBT 23096 TaxID=1392250 RepID=A0A2I2GIG1_9EURO|nr:uncharacterized protein P170DRAFT_423505 [Aspergillus steynii IBT 23096]PLB52663.1 hypothetical protein P170DRAFT_423505 [Aspergillus steynii IBT 23096]